MFNLTGGEIFILLLIGLVVLGPEKLPDALRKAGQMYNEVRRFAGGLQKDVTAPFTEPLDELRKTANDARRLFVDGPESGDTSNPTESEPRFIPYEADEPPESQQLTGSEATNEAEGDVS